MHFLTPSVYYVHVTNGFIGVVYKVEILEDFERESIVHNCFKILVKWSLLYNITSTLIEGSLYSAEASISMSEKFIN